MNRPTAVRLVLFLTLEGPRAAVYPVDAGPFTTPLATFRLRDDQVLPRAGPGARASIEGELRVGTRPVFWVDGTAIVPLGHLESAHASGRLFAERGDIIGDPRAIGWDPSWRIVVPSSRLDVASWESRLGKARREGVIAVVVTIAAVLATILTAVAGRPRVGFLAAVIPAAVVSIRAWRHARRARAALAQARANEATENGRWLELTLAWVAGTIRGPHAVASLRDTDTKATIADVPIVGVPAGYDPPPGRLVRVVGDPCEAPVIHDGPTTLWPAEHADPAAGAIGGEAG